MSLEIPPGLQWLSYLAGSSWPKGDEDALFALSHDWTDAAEALHGILAPLQAACDTASANYSGSGADQMKSQFDQFFSGDNSVEKIVEGLEQLADSVFDCGQQTEYAKLQIIITLAVMAAEIAYALATLWGAWAVSLIEAEGAGIMRLIASRLATALAARASRLAATPLWKLTAIQVLKQGAIGLGTDALAQGIELSQGHSKGFNVKQMFITGAVGAISGGVATPIGHFGGKYLGNIVAKNGGMTWWKAGLVAVGSGIPAGVVGAGAGIVAYGAMTGNWEFDPAALLGGVGGGLVGGVHGVMGHFQGKFTAGMGGFEELPPYTSEDKPPSYSDGSSSLSDTKSWGSDVKSDNPTAFDSTPVNGNSQRPAGGSNNPPIVSETSRNGGSIPANGANRNGGSVDEGTRNSSNINGNRGNVNANSTNGNSHETVTSNGGDRNGPAAGFDQTSRNINGDSNTHLAANSRADRTPQRETSIGNGTSNGRSFEDAPASRWSPIRESTGSEVNGNSDAITTNGSRNGSSQTNPFTQSSDRSANPASTQSSPIRSSGISRDTSSPVRQAMSSNLEGASTRPAQPPRSYSTATKVADGSTQTNPFRTGTQDQPRPTATLGNGKNPFRTTGTKLTANGTDQLRATPSTEPSRNPFGTTVEDNPDRNRYRATVEDVPDESETPRPAPTDPQRRNPFRTTVEEVPNESDTRFSTTQDTRNGSSSLRPADQTQSTPLSRTGPDNRTGNTNPFRPAQQSNERNPGGSSPLRRDETETRSQAIKSGDDPLSRISTERRDPTETSTEDRAERPTVTDRSGDLPGPTHEHSLTDYLTGARVVNDCSRQVLQRLASDFPGNRRILAPKEPVGLRGMDALEFEMRSTGTLQSFPNHEAVGEALREFGPGAKAAVIETYRGPADQHGIGAHAVVMTVRNKNDWVWDPATNRETPLIFHDRGDVAGVTAVLYSADGSPTHAPGRALDGARATGNVRIGSSTATEPHLTETSSRDEPAPPDDIPAAATDHEFDGPPGRGWDEVTELGSQPQQLTKAAFGKSASGTHDLVAFGDESGARYIWSRSGGLTDAEGRAVPRSTTLDTVLSDSRITDIRVPGNSDHPATRQTGPEDPQSHNDFPAESTTPKHDAEVYQRLVAAQERAEQHQQQVKEAIQRSGSSVEEARRALAAAEASHDDARISEARAVYEQAAEDHRQTVETAVDKLMADADKAGTDAWKAFQDGHIGQDDAFPLVRRQRVSAAKAAAEALLEHYDIQAGKDRSGPLGRLSTEELEQRILTGSEKDSRAAQIELFRRGTGGEIGGPGGKVLRWTQLTSEILMRHGPVEMDTGEGKELTAISRATRTVLDKGIAHVMTSSDPLVVHMQHEFESLVAGDHGLGIDVYHLDSDQPFPERVEGRKLIVLGTAQDYGFRAVKEAQAVVDKLKDSGMSTEELTQLRADLEQAPSMKEYKQILDAAAESRGLPDRFEPFPGGDLIIDEIDAQLIDEQTHYVLSPGKSGPADESFANRVHDIWNTLQEAKERGVLGPADFGKDPDKRGVFDSKMTRFGRAKLAIMLRNGQRDISDADAEELAHAAQAEWGPERNSDYHVSEDGKIKIISSQTNDQVMDDPEKQSSSRWNGFAKYLEAKNGLSITADSEHSLSITGKQIFSGGHFDHITGMSGTLLTPTEGNPRGVEDVMHEEYGTGPISKVDRFFKSQLQTPDARHFTSGAEKFQAMANDILDTAFVRNTDTGEWEQKGSPQLAIAMDNADVARLSDALDHAASERGLEVKYDKLDVAWVDSHGSKDRANDELQKVIANGGEMGRIILGNKMMGRGVDITPSKDAIANGGLKVKISGGPAYSERVNHQAETRAARSGNPNGDWATGGTPGEAVHYISPEDYRSAAPNARVKTFITRYQEAANEYREATAAHQNGGNEHTEANLEQTRTALDSAEKDLRDLATPMQKAAVEQQLLNSRRTDSDPSRAPPLADGTDSQSPVTPPPRSTEGTSTSTRPAPNTDGSNNMHAVLPPDRLPHGSSEQPGAYRAPGSRPFAFQPRQDFPTIETLLGDPEFGSTTSDSEQPGTPHSNTSHNLGDDGNRTSTATPPPGFRPEDLPGPTVSRPASSTYFPSNSPAAQHNAGFPQTTQTQAGPSAPARYQFGTPTFDGSAAPAKLPPPDTQEQPRTEPPREFPASLAPYERQQPARSRFGLGRLFQGFSRRIPTALVDGRRTNVQEEPWHPPATMRNPYLHLSGDSNDRRLAVLPELRTRALPGHTVGRFGGWLAMHWLQHDSSGANQFDYTTLTSTQRQDAINVIAGLRANSDERTLAQWLRWAELSLGDDARHELRDSVQLRDLPADTRVWMLNPYESRALAVQRIGDSDEFRVYDPQTGRQGQSHVSVLENLMRQHGISDLVIAGPADRSVAPTEVSATQAVTSAHEVLPTYGNVGEGPPAYPALPDYTAPEDLAAVWGGANCAVVALEQLSAFTGRPRPQVPESLAGITGMPANVLSDRAGAPLTRFDNHDHIATQLTRIGPGAVALVVDEYRGYTDANGVGAHAYLLRVNDDGSVAVHDASDPDTRSFPPHVPRELAGTHAVLYSADGVPMTVDPAMSDQLPATTMIGARSTDDSESSDPPSGSNLSRTVWNFGKHFKGAEDFVYVAPIPENTIKWLRQQAIHMVETEAAKQPVATVSSTKPADTEGTEQPAAADNSKKAATPTDDKKTDDKKPTDSAKPAYTGPDAKRKTALTKALDGPETPKDPFHAAVKQKLTPRLTTAEMYRLLSKSGMPLAAEYKGNPFPVFLRLKLTPRENSRPNNGPPVSLQRWTYGNVDLGSSASEHSQRSFSFPYTHLFDVEKGKLVNWGLTPQINFTHNQLSSAMAVIGSVQSVIKKRSTDSDAIPHDFDMHWEMRYNPEGLAGVLSPDIRDHEDDWVKIDHEAAPDLLTAWFPNHLHDNKIKIPEAGKDDKHTPPPFHRAADYSESDGKTKPYISIEQMPFYGALDFPAHDELFADVMKGFPDQIKNISKASAVQLRTFFGDNLRGNIPMMHGGSVQSPTMYTSSGKPLGFFDVEIVDFHGGDTLTGPVTAEGNSRLEYNVVRGLRTQARSAISNRLGAAIAFSLGLAQGKSDKATGYATRGGNITPFKGGITHQNSHALTYGGRGYISRALRLVARLLHTTPEMEIRVKFVRPDGAAIPPKSGTPLNNPGKTTSTKDVVSAADATSPAKDGTNPVKDTTDTTPTAATGKRYPINMLVPSKASLGRKPQAGEQRFLPPHLLHLQNLDLLTTPLQVDIPDNILDGVEKFVSDMDFLPSASKANDLLDLSSTAEERLENSRKLSQMKARLTKLATFDEMLQNGFRTEFNGTTAAGLDPARITVTIKAVREYDTPDGKYDPKADPNQGVTHDWRTPILQTMNYSGIILSSGEESESTPLAVDAGASASFTNPLNIFGTQRLSSLTASYDFSYGKPKGSGAAQYHAEENYTFSPKNSGEQDYEGNAGLEIFGVRTRYIAEISYSHGHGPAPIEGKGKVSLAVPHYLTTGTPNTDPVALPRIRADHGAKDALPADITKGLGLASKKSIEDGVGRIPLSAVVANHPVGEILHEATRGLIDDIELEAAAEARDFDPSTLDIPGKFPEDRGPILPIAEPRSRRTEDPSSWWSNHRAGFHSWVPDLSGWRPSLGPWFRKQDHEPESIDLPEHGTTSTSRADVPETTITIPKKAVTTGTEAEEAPKPLKELEPLPNPLEPGEKKPKIPGDWPDENEKGDDTGTTTPEDGESWGHWAWSKATGVGKWIWRTAFGDPATDPASQASSVLHASMSPQHMIMYAPLIFRDSYKFETEIPGKVTGTDYSVDIRGFFDNIRALEPTAVDTEHWLEANNATTRTTGVNSGHKGAFIVGGTYGEESDHSLRPSGGWQGSNSTNTHVTKGDATDTMRVTSDYGGKVYRFVADGHYAVTVKAGWRNFLSGLAHGKPYGTRTRIVDAPNRLEFFLTDNDLHDYPEYKALLVKTAGEQGWKLDIIPEGQEKQSVTVPQDDGTEKKVDKYVPVEPRLLSDAYVGKRPDAPDTAKALPAFGGATEVIFDDGRGALENAATTLLEKISPGATVVGHNNYHPGVAPLINAHTTSYGVRNLANAGSEGKHSFHFVDRSGGIPRMVGVTFTQRPQSDKDMPDGRTLATIEGKMVPRTAALDNVHRHIRADGNALVEPGATNVGSSHSQSNQLSVGIGGQSNQQRPGATLAIQRTGTHSEVQNSTRDLSAWQRSAARQYEFKIPTEWTVTVDWRTMDETLSGYLYDKLGDFLVTGGTAIAEGQALITTGEWRGVAEGLDPDEIPTPSQSESDSVKATTFMRVHEGDTKPKPKPIAKDGETPAAEVARTEPQVFGFDPTKSKLEPAKAIGTPETVDLEAATAVKPAEKVPDNVRELLSVPSWKPELAFDIREFDASQQFAEALLRVDPSLRTNDNTRVAEGMYNRLVTLVAKGDFVQLGPQSTAPFLNVEQTGTVPTPQQHATGVKIGDTVVKMSLYSPREEDGNDQIAFDVFEFSVDNMGSSSSRNTSTALSFGYSGAKQTNDRGGPSSIPLGGDVSGKGGTVAIGSVLRNLFRTNVKGGKPEGKRLRSVAVVEVIGPKGTLWVTGDLILRSNEKPPDSANLPKFIAPKDDSAPFVPPKESKPKADETDETDPAKKAADDKAAADKAAAEKKAAEDKAAAEKKTAEDKAAAEKKAAADKAAADKAAADKAAADKAAAEKAEAEKKAEEEAEAKANKDAEAKKAATEKKSEPKKKQSDSDTEGEGSTTKDPDKTEDDAATEKAEAEAAAKKLAAEKAEAEAEELAAEKLAAEKAEAEKAANGPDTKSSNATTPKTEKFDPTGAEKLDPDEIKAQAAAADKLAAELKAAKAGTEAEASAESSKPKTKSKGFISTLFGGSSVSPTVGRKTGPRSHVVDGIAAPRGYVWESMPPDGDCFFHALERIMYSTPYTSAAELDRRIRELRLMTAAELVGPRMNEYLLAFTTIRNADRNLGRQLTAAEEQNPISAADQIAHFAEYIRQVRQLTQRGVWRTDVFHVVPQAAAAALARLSNNSRNVRVYGQDMRRGQTFGPNATAPADAATLVAFNHYHLAVPTGDHAPTLALPTRPWDDFASLLTFEFDEYNPQDNTQTAPGPGRITIFGDAEAARYLWFPSAGSKPGEMLDANSQPVDLTFDEAIADPAVTVVRTPAVAEEATGPDLKQTDPELAAAIDESVAEFHAAAAKAKVEAEEKDPDLAAAIALSLEGLEKPGTISQSTQSVAEAATAATEFEEGSTEPTATAVFDSGLDKSFDKGLYDAEGKLILPPASPTGTIIHDPSAEDSKAALSEGESMGDTTPSVAKKLDPDIPFGPLPSSLEPVSTQQKTSSIKPVEHYDDSSDDGHLSPKTTNFEQLDSDEEFGPLDTELGDHSFTLHPPESLTQTGIRPIPQLDESHPAITSDGKPLESAELVEETITDAEPIEVAESTLPQKKTDLAHDDASEDEPLRPKTSTPPASESSDSARPQRELAQPTEVEPDLTADSSKQQHDEKATTLETPPLEQQRDDQQVGAPLSAAGIAKLSSAAVEFDEHSAVDLTLDESSEAIGQYFPAESFDQRIVPQGNTAARPTGLDESTREEPIREVVEEDSTDDMSNQQHDEEHSGTIPPRIRIMRSTETMRYAPLGEGTQEDPALVGDDHEGHESEPDHEGDDAEMPAVIGSMIRPPRLSDIQFELRTDDEESDDFFQPDDQEPRTPAHETAFEPTTPQLRSSSLPREGAAVSEARARQPVDRTGLERPDEPGEQESEYEDDATPQASLLNTDGVISEAAPLMSPTIHPTGRPFRLTDIRAAIRIHDDEDESVHGTDNTNLPPHTESITATDSSETSPLEIRPEDRTNASDRRDQPSQSRPFRPDRTVRWWDDDSEDAVTQRPSFRPVQHEAFRDTGQSRFPLVPPRRTFRDPDTGQRVFPLVPPREFADSATRPFPSLSGEQPQGVDPRLNITTTRRGPARSLENISPQETSDLTTPQDSTSSKKVTTAEEITPLEGVTSPEDLTPPEDVTKKVDPAEAITSAEDPPLPKSVEESTEDAPSSQGRTIPLSDGSAPTRIGDTPTTAREGRNPWNRLRRWASRIGTPSDRTTNAATPLPTADTPRRHFRDLFRRPLDRLRRETTTPTPVPSSRTARGDGATAHTMVTNRRTTTLRDSLTNTDCVVGTLTALRNTPSGNRIRIPQGSTPLPGRTRRDLEWGARGRLRGFPDQSAIVRNLQIHGPGAHAIVVAEHATPMTNGIGAHAYLMFNDRGLVRVHDVADPTHTLPGQHHPAAVHAILYTPEGNTVRPLLPRGATVPRFPSDIRIGAPEYRSGGNRTSSTVPDRTGSSSVNPHGDTASSQAGHRNTGPGIDGTARTNDTAPGSVRRRGLQRLQGFVSRLRGRNAAVASSSTPSTSSAARDNRTRPAAESPFRSIRTLFGRNRVSGVGTSDITVTGTAQRFGDTTVPGDGATSRTTQLTSPAPTSLDRLNPGQRSAILAHTGKPAVVDEFLADPDGFVRDWDAAEGAPTGIEILWPGQRPPAFDDLRPQLEEMQRIPEEDLEYAKLEMIDRLHELLAADDPRREWQNVADDFDRYHEFNDHFGANLNAPFSIDELRKQIRLLDEATSAQLPITTPMRLVSDDRTLADLLSTSGVDSEVLHRTFTAAAETSSSPLVELTVPPGARGVLSGDPAQPQLLLPRDTVFRFTGLSDSGRITAEVVPPAPGSTGTGYLPTGEPRRSSIDSFDSQDNSRPDSGRVVGGVRYFADDAARQTFAHNVLRTWDELSAEVRHALRRYEEGALINIAMRRGTASGIDQWVAHLVESADLWQAREDELHRAGVSPWGPDEEQLAVPSTLLDARPAARWEQIRSDARMYELVRDHFGSRDASAPLDAATLHDHMRVLDEATGAPLRLDGTVHVTRSLATIDFLTAADGQPLGDRNPDLLIGAVQQEPGYLSTSFASRVLHMPDKMKYRVALAVPPGARGVYIGSDARDPYKLELILPRDTRYRITRVERPNRGLPVLHAELLLPPQPGRTSGREPEPGPSAHDQDGRTPSDPKGKGRSEAEVLPVGPSGPGTASSHAPRAAGIFEPAAGDTYLGDNLRQQLQIELDGETHITRPQLDRPDPGPQQLHSDQQLPQLTLTQREQLLPMPAVPTRIARPAGDTDILTLVDNNGRVERLAAVGAKVPARLVQQPGLPAHYQFSGADGQVHNVLRDLAQNFTFEQTSGTDTGTLSWNVAGGGIRFLAFDQHGQWQPAHMPYDAPLVARDGHEPWRWVKYAGNFPWIRVNTSGGALPALPEIRGRHNDPLFGPSGLPAPEEVRQGSAGDCSLLADLRSLAQYDPHAIAEILHDHGDGTVSVRFLAEQPDGSEALEWVRVEKTIYVVPGTETGYFVRHEPGEPLWATMIEKAFAHRFGNGDGYRAIEGLPMTTAAARLGKGFHRAEGDWFAQPVARFRNVDILHPLRFDIDTLHELVSDYIRSDTANDRPPPPQPIRNSPAGSPKPFRTSKSGNWRCSIPRGRDWPCATTTTRTPSPSPGRSSCARRTPCLPTISARIWISSIRSSGNAKSKLSQTISARYTTGGRRTACCRAGPRPWPGRSAAESNGRCAAGRR
ncbi:WXG100-like domain-containing protein [Nocardia vaccinii]|uniref:WXG100-like domain-containing protein n=1 Tax=Nocardia vaccinii TaxID=1822 RepID=UPI00082EDC06|nr:ADP-ribosyltransferase [Nocardia vaccinii]